MNNRVQKFLRKNTAGRRCTPMNFQFTNPIWLLRPGCGGAVGGLAVVEIRRANRPLAALDGAGPAPAGRAGPGSGHGRAAMEEAHRRHDRLFHARPLAKRAFAAAGIGPRLCQSNCQGKKAKRHRRRAGLRQRSRHRIPAQCRRWICARSRPWSARSGRTSPAPSAWARQPFPKPARSAWSCCPTATKTSATPCPPWRRRGRWA